MDLRVVSESLVQESGPEKGHTHALKLTQKNISREGFGDVKQGPRIEAQCFVRLAIENRAVHHDVVYTRLGLGFRV